MLDDLMTEVKAKLSSFSIYTRDRTVQEMFANNVTEFYWLTDATMGPYEKPLKALLLGIPLTIFVHEREDGRTFDVMSGGEIIEGLRFYMSSMASRPLSHKILNSKIRVVTFRCTMSYQDVKTCMEYLT